MTSICTVNSACSKTRDQLIIKCSHVVQVNSRKKIVWRAQGFPARTEGRAACLVLVLSDRVRRGIQRDDDFCHLGWLAFLYISRFCGDQPDGIDRLVCMDLAQTANPLKPSVVCTVRYATFDYESRTGRALASGVGRGTNSGGITSGLPIITGQYSDSLF